ncbi:hypothetical protein JCM11251_001618 [Rhodosporidiobolus azoricus]
MPVPEAAADKFFFTKKRRKSAAGTFGGSATGSNVADGEGGEQEILQVTPTATRSRLNRPVGRKMPLSTTPPLLRLPDEILALIFSLCMDKHPTLSPFSVYLINKRIASIAHPIWISHPVCQEAQQPAFFEHLIRHPDRDLAKRVVSFDMWCPCSYRAGLYESAIMSLFTNLTTLTLRFSSEDAYTEGSLSRDMLCMLCSLPRLVDLRLAFESEWVIEARQFSIRTDLPRLRRLTLSSLGECDAEEVLDPLPTNLEHLELDIDTPQGEYRQIPWSHLRSFEANLPADNPPLFLGQVFEKLEEAAEAAKPAMIPLRRFKLRNPVFGKKPFRATDIPPIAPERLLCTLSATAVASLSLVIGKHLFVGREVQLVPSLEVLHLSTSDCSMSKPDNYASLINLVSLFPSLHTLILDGISFVSPTLPYAAERTHPYDADFFDLHPSLRVFLGFLRKETKVTRLDWDPMGRRRYWTRLTAKEPHGKFTMETFTEGK